MLKKKKREIGKWRCAEPMRATNGGETAAPLGRIKKTTCCTADGNGDHRDSLTDNQEVLADSYPVVE